jgi:signal transduction histidine kinase
VKLRVRFTVGFALAALVPIVVAAVVTRQVVSQSYSDDHEATRAAAEQTIRGEIARLEAQVSSAIVSLASREHPFTGGILLALRNNGGVIDPKTDGRTIKEQAGPIMRGLSLEVLQVTGSGDSILASGHFPDSTADIDPIPARRGRALPRKVYFAVENILTGPSKESYLVAEAAAIARDGAFEVAVLAGKRVDAALVAGVRRRGRVDARIVDARGQVEVPPADPAAWASLAGTQPIRIPLHGFDGPGAKPIGWIEVAVSAGDLEPILARVTLISVVLAVAAVVLMILLGLVVARRITRDLDGLVAGALAAARGDLDHRVPVRAKDEIGAVGAAFNFMMEDLRSSKDRLVIAERIAAWQEIARRLAHEIKNPLTPIQMAMDTLRKTWKKQHPSFDEILEESTSTVLEEADRLKRIVSEFSDFARMPKPDFRKCDLNDVVSSAMSLYQGAAPVEHKLAQNLPEIEADKGQLSQVLLNLVENARDAIGALPSGKIVVATRLGEAADRVQFSVEDNGPGVPTELKDRVFQPYFTTKTGRGGTGLGLAIVHRIISDHGGRISLAEVSGGGARFIVELPLRQGTPLLASRI